MDFLASMFLVTRRPEHFDIRKLNRQSWVPTFDQWIDINYRYCSEVIIDCFKYHAIISRYRESVGEDRIFIYTFEEFLQDPIAMSERILAFMGVGVDRELIATEMRHDENCHATKRAYYYRQLRTLLFPDTRLADYLPRSAVRGLSKILQASEKISVDPKPETIERLRNYYAEDNRLLEENMGTRLQSKFPGA